MYLQRLQADDRYRCPLQVGVNASSQDVLQHLIKADTASAFNISVGDVNVTGISQVRLLCNVFALTHADKATLKSP